MIWGVPLSSSDLFWFWRSSDWIWGVPLDVVGVHFGFGDVSLYLEHSALSFICRVFLRFQVTPRDLGKSSWILRRVFVNLRESPIDFGESF